jgi:hypothetical protein
MEKLYENLVVWLQPLHFYFVFLLNLTRVWRVLSEPYVHTCISEGSSGIHLHWTSFRKVLRSQNGPFYTRRVGCDKFPNCLSESTNIMQLHATAEVCEFCWALRSVLECCLNGCLYTCTQLSYQSPVARILTSRHFLLGSSRNWCHFREDLCSQHAQMCPSVTCNKLNPFDWFCSTSVWQYFLLHLKSPFWWLWRILSFGMWHHLLWYTFTEGHAVA